MTAASQFYNRWAKNRPGWDVLAQSGYLLVFVLSVWLADLPPIGWPMWAFGALFAMHSHLFGEIMDIAPDHAAGRRVGVGSMGGQRRCPC